MIDTQTAITEAQKMIGNELPFSVDGKGNDAWMAALSAKINHLIQHDFHKLAAVLYRLDVSEKKLKQVLQQQCGNDAGNIIALLIVERQLQKIQTRQQFRHDGGDIPAHEKW